MRKVGPLEPGWYIVRALNVAWNNPNKLELLSRPLETGNIAQELEYHSSVNRNHSVFVIRIPPPPPQPE